MDDALHCNLESNASMSRGHSPPSPLLLDAFIYILNVGIATVTAAKRASVQSYRLVHYIHTKPLLSLTISTTAAAAI